jgi:hypothetical protein
VEDQLVVLEARPGRFCVVRAKSPVFGAWQRRGSLSMTEPRDPCSYGHPFSPYCQKALIALLRKDIPFEIHVPDA